LFPFFEACPLLGIQNARLKELGLRYLREGGEERRGGGEGERGEELR